MGKRIDRRMRATRSLQNRQERRRARSVSGLCGRLRDPALHRIRIDWLVRPLHRQTPSHVVCRGHAPAGTANVQTEFGLQYPQPRLPRGDRRGIGDEVDMEALQCRDDEVWVDLGGRVQQPWQPA
jgi:hypothetical protein